VVVKEVTAPTKWGKFFAITISNLISVTSRKKEYIRSVMAEAYRTNLKYETIFIESMSGSPRWNIFSRYKCVT
jgi:hypothetical protein